MDTIKVISATDSRYVQHLGVTFVSLLENTAEKDRIELYVIDGGLSDRDRELLKLCVAGYGCKLHFLAINSWLYEKFAESPSASAATYFRIFVPDLMDASIEKVIFLDCDIVVVEDIKYMWDVDVSGHFLAAVEDCGVEDSGLYGITHKKNLKMAKKDRYFNAGVLLINLAKWRENHVSEKVRDFLIKNPDKASFADQDGLNTVLKNQWLPLPRVWNQQVTFWELYRQKKVIWEDMKEALKRPCIIHYTTSYYIRTKPWKYMDMHPNKREYYRYLSLTPWKDYVPNDRSFRNMLYKNFSRTFIGKRIIKYVELVNYLYGYESSTMPEKFTGTAFNKFKYFVFFPAGYVYISFFAKLAKYSYALEKKTSSDNGKLNAVQKMLYTLTYPSRNLVYEYLRVGIKNEIFEEKYTCPCCGYKILKNKPPETDEVCGICFWQYDKVQSDNPDSENGVNEVSLNHARRNFLSFKASDKRYMHFVRKPGRYDEKDETAKNGTHLSGVCTPEGRMAAMGGTGNETGKF